MNKFQMIALEMKKKGFKELPSNVTSNAEFEEMVRDKFCVLKGGEKCFYSGDIEVKISYEIFDISEQNISYEVMTNESQWCA